MLKSRIHIILIIVLLLAGAVQLSAQTVPPKADEGKLIAVLKSSDATHKEKVDACRGLALIATDKSIAPLAALLSDEKLSHMARYALETIKDPAVDEVFRDALSKLKGMPLVGVIGSVGVRRDAKAVESLTSMLQDSNPEVAQAAARALGSIGNVSAMMVLVKSMREVGGINELPAANKLSFCEGLLRCAENLAAEGKRDLAIELYEALIFVDDVHQVRSGALRGAILTRGKDGIPLLQKHLRSDSYIMFSAACQAALEMPGEEVTKALTSALKDLPADS